jgi:predicted nucleotidyltransferase
VQHHEDSIAAFIQRIRGRDDVLAVILDGSVASGRERPDSDVDLVLVVTEEAFEQAWRENRLSYVERDSITYGGGYYDLKVASLPYLQRAVDDADDPMRASLLHARVVWSGIDDLEPLLTAIARLPEEVWEHRMASFIAQLRLHGGYFLRQAVEQDNEFLLHHAAVHMVGAGGRALLALNRTLFQGQKYLDQTLARLGRVPDGYADASRALLRQPSLATGAAYRELVESFHPWPIAEEQTLSTYVRDNELSWYTGRAPIEYA